MRHAAQWGTISMSSMEQQTASTDNTHGSLTLVANPGSASRKYALFAGDQERAQLHFEWLHGKVVCSLHVQGRLHTIHVELEDIRQSVRSVIAILKDNQLLSAGEYIECIGLRVVAPHSFFLKDHVVDDYFVEKLEEVKPRAPIHIAATLEELKMLRRYFPEVRIIGVSDSAFHATKPDYAWNYGISLEDADRFEIKRFGYHGLSVASVVRELQAAEKLPPKLLVCHLGSGASVSAIHGGKSIDTTMGYSPLEGTIMSTRSGSIDPAAVQTIKDIFHFDDNKLGDYLNNHSGLLGLGGSADIRELLRREADGDHRSHLALQTYIYTIQKAIGQMASALGGVDAIVFTGIVSERSAPIRSRIIARLHYLDFILDQEANEQTQSPPSLTVVSRLAHSKPIYVAAANESEEIARHVQLF